MINMLNKDKFPFSLLSDPFFLHVFYKKFGSPMRLISFWKIAQDGFYTPTGIWKD